MVLMILFAAIASVPWDRWCPPDGTCSGTGRASGASRQKAHGKGTGSKAGPQAGPPGKAGSIPASGASADCTASRARCRSAAAVKNPAIGLRRVSIP